MTESFEAVEYPWYFKLITPPKRALRGLKEGVQKTLAKLKSVAEGSA